MVNQHAFSIHSACHEPALSSSSQARPLTLPTGLSHQLVPVRIHVSSLLSARAFAFRVQGMAKRTSKKVAEGLKKPKANVPRGKRVDQYVTVMA